MSGRQYSCREKFAVDIAKLVIFCYFGKGYGVTKGEAYRTKEQQKIHRKAGRSKVKVSQHQKRLAEDVYIWSKTNPRKYISDKEWLKVGEYWEALDPQNRWGGRYGIPKKDYNKKIGWDRTHFERRG